MPTLDVVTVLVPILLPMNMVFTLFVVLQALDFYATYRALGRYPMFAVEANKFVAMLIARLGLVPALMFSKTAAMIFGIWIFLDEGYWPLLAVTALYLIEVGISMMNLRKLVKMHD